MAAVLDAVRALHAFHSRPNGPSPSPDADFASPATFFAEAGISAVAFLALHALSSVVVPRLLPGFAKLDAATQKRFVDKGPSFIHHLVMAPWALLLLVVTWKDQAHAAPGAHVDYTRNLTVAGASTGYFIADAVLTLPRIRRQPEFLFHHLLIVALSFVGASVRMARWIPTLLVCELSSIPLDVSWALRQYGLQGTRAYNIVAAIFLTTFVATRIVNLPLAAVVAFTRFEDDLIAVLGVWRWVIVPLVALQFYWLARLLMQLFGSRVQKAARWCCGAVRAAH